MDTLHHVALCVRHSPFGSLGAGAACWLGLLLQRADETHNVPAAEGPALPDSSRRPSSGAVAPHTPPSGHADTTAGRPSSSHRGSSAPRHPHRNSADAAKVRVPPSATQDPSAEPTPQSADNLISGWADGHNTQDMSHASHIGATCTPAPSASGGDRSGSRRRHMDTTSTSRVLSKRAIAAQRNKEAAVREHQFWENRLKLLRREAEEAERNLSIISHAKGGDNNTSQIEDAVRQQLREEQQRNAKTRAERLAANKVQREAHAKALRDAHHASLIAKRATSRKLRQESAEAEMFVEEQHNRELHRRTLLKEAVQQEKVIQVLTRARVRALRAEETKRLYESKIDMMEEEDLRQQQATAALIQESSKYVQKMRLLKEQQRLVESGEGGVSSSASRVHSPSSSLAAHSQERSRH